MGYLLLVHVLVFQAIAWVEEGHDDDRNKDHPNLASAGDIHYRCQHTELTVCLTR
jgi:hypothetical protein